MTSQDSAIDGRTFGCGLTRRALLAASGSAVLMGGVLGGCAAPPSEAPAFDPRELVYPPPPETPRFYFDNTIWGSGSVIEETSTDRFRRFATGESLRGRGFAKPFGVAADRGRIYISDTVSRHVHVLDFPGKQYSMMGRKGVGRLTKPLGMATDQAGRIYVVDGTAQRVLVYDPQGTYITSIGNGDQLERPSAVAVTPDGTRVYVLDTGGVRSDRHQVAVYDGSGRLERNIGRRGIGEGEFNLPLDCCLGPDGRLYVVDTGNFRIQVFSADGAFHHAFGKVGRRPGQFGHPKGIAVDSSGIIYVTDTNFGIFQLFNTDGQILMWVGERSESAGPGKFILPAGIAVDVDGRVYAVDQFFQKVDVFRPASLPIDWPIGQSVA